ncbi:acyl carrier protein [Pseudomonadota bacterium]
MTRNELYKFIEGILVEKFEVEKSKISMGANLYEHLEIDSIDAVDLVVHLKEFTGKKIQPEQFKEVRTVEDVIEAIMTL